MIKTLKKRRSIISNFICDLAARLRFNHGHQAHSMISYLHHKYKYIVFLFFYFLTLNKYHARGNESRTEQRERERERERERRGEIGIFFKMFFK